MNQLLQTYLIGLAILIVAIIANYLAAKLGVSTWYSFLNEITEQGLKETISTKWPHLFFLIIIYPAILGATAYYFFKLIYK